MDWLSSLMELSGLPPSLLEPLSIIRVILGFIFVFLLPGFAWTLVFFKKINIIERLALSFGLSIAVVILSIFSLNLLAGVKITGFNSALVIIAVTIIPVAFYYLNRIMKPL